MFNKTIDYLLESRDLSLHMQKLDFESLHFRLYADASLATSLDHTSQLRYIVLLCDKLDNACVVHYTSYKSHRVARSVLGAEPTHLLRHTTSHIAPREIWNVFSAELYHSKYIQIRRVYSRSPLSFRKLKSDSSWLTYKPHMMHASVTRFRMLASFDGPTTLQTQWTNDQSVRPCMISYALAKQI